MAPSVGRTNASVEYNSHDHTKLVRTMQNQPTFVNRMNSTILSMKRVWTTTRKAACKRSTQVEAVFRENFVQCISKVMKKLCNERSMS